VVSSSPSHTFTQMYTHITSSCKYKNYCSLCTLIDGRTDGWMVGWMDGWMDRSMDGWICGWMEGWMDGRAGGRTDGWTDGETDGQAGGRAGRQTDRQTDHHRCILVFCRNALSSGTRLLVPNYKLLHNLTSLKTVNLQSSTSKPQPWQWSCRHNNTLIITLFPAYTNNKCARYNCSVMTTRFTCGNWTATTVNAAQ
jgi:hypothetical protein